MPTLALAFKNPFTKLLSEENTLYSLKESYLLDLDRIISRKIFPLLFDPSFLNQRFLLVLS